MIPAGCVIFKNKVKLAGQKLIPYSTTNQIKL